MVAAMEVPADAVSSYGIRDVAAEAGRQVRVAGMVEKPSAGAAPSRLAVIGRYILTPRILSHLDAATEGAGGEIQLTDAIAREIDGEGVHGYRFEGERFDCGSKAGFLQATVALALARQDLRGDFERFLGTLALPSRRAQP